MLSLPIFPAMTTLTIRNLPDPVRDRLRVRAAQNGRSMEAEAREALGRLYAPEPSHPERSAPERVRRLQETMAPFRSDTGNVSDELLADRREEARRENETERHEEERGEPPPITKSKTQVEKLARARAVLRRRVPEGTNLVDEFLAERRAMWG